MVSTDWDLKDPSSVTLTLTLPSYTLVDVRSARAYDAEAIAQIRSVPALDTVGLGLERKEVCADGVGG